MKVLLISFSGTGMTRYYADLIREEFVAAGNHCVCSDLEELVDLPALWQRKPVVLNYTLRAEKKRPLSEPPICYPPLGTAVQSAEEFPGLQRFRKEWAGYDLIGFGSPVYEYRPAPVMIRFLLDLPFFTDAPPVFTFATHDGAQGDFAPFMRKLLTQKGFSCLGHLDQDFIYSAAFILRKGYNRAKAGRALARKSARARQKINGFIDRLGDAVEDQRAARRPRAGFADRLIAFPWRLAYTWGMDILLSIFYSGFGLDKDNCIQCHTCIRQCPQGLIEKDSQGYPVRYRHCMSCLRCLNWCPTGTLYLSKLTREKARFPGAEALLEAAREHHPERWVKK